MRLLDRVGFNVTVSSSSPAAYAEAAERLYRNRSPNQTVAIWLGCGDGNFHDQKIRPLAVRLARENAGTILIGAPSQAFHKEIDVKIHDCKTAEAWVALDPEHAEDRRYAMPCTTTIGGVLPQTTEGDKFLFRPKTHGRMASGGKGLTLSRSNKSNAGDSNILKTPGLLMQMNVRPLLHRGVYRNKTVATPVEMRAHGVVSWAPDLNVFISEFGMVRSGSPHRMNEPMHPDFWKLNQAPMLSACKRFTPGDKEFDTGGTFDLLQEVCEASHGRVAWADLWAEVDRSITMWFRAHEQGMRASLPTSKNSSSRPVMVYTHWMADIGLTSDGKAVVYELSLGAAFGKEKGHYPTRTDIGEAAASIGLMLLPFCNSLFLESEELCARTLGLRPLLPVRNPPQKNPSLCLPRLEPVLVHWRLSPMTCDTKDHPNRREKFYAGC